GLTYAIDPTAETGKRISDMAIGGKPIDPDKTYKVASWAPVDPVDESLPPAYEVFADWLRSQKQVRAGEPNVPRIKGIKGNPGLDRAMLGG
ncbi:MAG: 5'-nucleotidase C-terminal domain-containing protein, partial [Thiohalorhabdaceae bacterium]